MRKTYDTITVEFSLFWPFPNFHSCNHLTLAILIFFLHYIKMKRLQESTCCRPEAFVSFFQKKRKFLLICHEYLVIISLDLEGG